MIISIASGKGGTGKTTIATNLAVALGPGVNLLDCDVEEPNDHIFIQPEVTYTERVSLKVPQVDMDKCTLCGRCQDICQFQAIVVVGKSVLTFPELCHSCGGCVEVCPEDAITEIDREMGVFEGGHRDSLEFSYGRLFVGQVMAVPVIERVRAAVQPDKVNIIDAPPGTSCPVISSVKGTDFVILVTEPTPFGLNDLKLAVGMVKILNIPHGILINCSDLGDTKVTEYAEQEHIPILMEIPFDRQIAETYSRGKLLVEELPDWKAKFIHLYEKITDLVRQE
ncbi:MAG: ATP-binding protein [Proteobacteria bacterium]|nr:ATP-binding protein [Pseudomonadota bacterium]